MKKFFCFLFIIFLLLGILYYIDTQIIFTNEEVLSYLIKDPNKLITENKGKKTLIKAINYLTNIDNLQNNGVIFVNKKNEVNDNKEPIIYIYNTHQKEEYSNSNIEIYNITPTVMMASYTLKEKLEDYNISSIVLEEDIVKEIKKNNLAYSASYNISRKYFKENMSEYSSLKYFIDLHRDGVSKEVSTVSINGKSYAKIMFVIGTKNEDYKENMQFMEELDSLLNKHYNGLSRGIFKRKYVYNQDLSKNAILIEVGGNHNTIVEVYNSMEALAFVLNKYINGEENE